MKRIAFLISIFLLTLTLKAQQIQVQAIQPNPYLLKSEEIFNLQVTNPTATAIEVKLKGVWFYQGQKAIELLAENTTLQPGVNILNTQNPGVASKTYLIKAVDEVETSTGTLPAGKYRACIYLSCIKPDCNGAGANVLTSETDPCYEFSVEQPTPLLLNSQANGNISNERRPVFTWIPPMPLGSNPDLTYTMILVQKNNKKQSCTDAILRNRPLLKEENIKGTLLNYPADIDQLDTGDYAWQVTAVYEGISVATSEAWCFRVEEKKEKKDSNIYVKLKTNDFDIHHCKQQLYFIYDEQYSSEKLNLKLYNQKGQEIKISQEFTTKYGECRFMLDLKKLGLVQNQVYTLRLKNQVNKNYTLKFQIIY